MKNFKLNSIKSKLMVISFFILTIPLIVLGVLSYQKSAESLDEIGITNLTNSVEMTIGMIEVLNEEVEKGNLTLETAQEKVKVSILGELNEDGTRPINPQIDLGENGYLFIIGNDGVQIAHPNLEGENIWEVESPDGVKLAQEVIKAAQAGGGLTYFDWPLPGNTNVTKPKVSYSKQDPYWGWNIVSGTYMMDFNKPANKIKELIYIMIGITLVVGTIIIWVFSNRVANPIQNVTRHMRKLADGDLMQDEIQFTSDDEVGQLACAMNEMQAKLKATLTGVAGHSSSLTEQSDYLTRSSNEVTSATEQVALTMQDLATGSESQANYAANLTEEMRTFTTKVQQANHYGDEIQQSTQTVMNMTNEGANLMSASTNQMAKIDAIVREAVKKVEGLDTHSQEISQLVSVIQEIAGQTNLLALNAAIEAARAGEQGKGFAVVADEVRKLAEESSRSVTNITDIVQRIQNESSAVAESLQESYEEVEQGTNQVMTTGEMFKDITSAVLEMVDKMHNISDSLSDIAHSTEGMNGSIQEIAAISEEAAAGIEETSAATEETNASMIEVATSSESLALLAEELNALVHQFKMK